MLAVGAAIGISAAFAPPPPHTTDNFAQALRFLRAVYPDLVDQGLGIYLGSPYVRKYDIPVRPLRSFSLILEHSATADHTDVKTRDSPFLRGSFEFDSHDRLEAFVADESPFLKSSERRQARDTMSAHRSWSPTELAMTLKQNGARFVPPDEQAIRRHVGEVLERLTPVMGVCRLVRVDWLQNDDPLWLTQVRFKRDPSGPSYQLLWEPFEGRLVALRRLD